jgi:hypothetical protein
MSIKNGDMPAMPTSPNSIDPNWAAARTGGLTKREMFAMHIMAGMASSNHGYHDYKYMASDAIKQADALLVELEHTK